MSTPTHPPSYTLECLSYLIAIPEYNTITKLDPKIRTASIPVRLKCNYTSSRCICLIAYIVLERMISV